MSDQFCSKFSPIGLNNWKQDYIFRLHALPTSWGILAQAFGHPSATSNNYSLNCCEIFWAVVLTLTSFLHTETLRICFVSTVSCFPFKKVQAARILGVFHRFPLRFLLFQLLRVAASCSGSRRPSSACVAGTYDLSTAKHTALSQRTSRAAAFVAKLPCPSEEDQLNALGELGALNDNHAKSYCYPQALGVPFHMTSPPGMHFIESDFGLSMSLVKESTQNQSWQHYPARGCSWSILSTQHPAESTLAKCQKSHSRKRSAGHLASKANLSILYWIIYTVLSIRARERECRWLRQKPKAQRNVATLESGMLGWVLVAESHPKYAETLFKSIAPCTSNSAPRTLDPLIHTANVWWNNFWFKKKMWFFISTVRQVLTYFDTIHWFLRPSEALAPWCNWPVPLWAPAAITKRLSITLPITKTT